MLNSRDMFKGNLVDWTTAEWTLENMIAEKRSIDEVCQLPVPKDVLFPEKRNMSDVKLLCNRMGGNVSVVKDKEMQTRLVEQFQIRLPDQYGVNGNILLSCIIPYNITR
jgi:hypothetical protein